MRITAIAAAAALILTGFTAQAETVDIDSLIEKAFSRNTRLESMKYDVRASKSLESVAGSLPDPMVSLGYINEGTDRITLGDEMAGMTRFTVMFSQMFPFPGKLKAQTEQAGFRTKTAEINRQNEKLSIIYNIKTLYLDLYRIQESKKLLDSKISFLGLLEAAAEARFRSAQGSSAEVLMFQREKYMAFEAKEMLEEQERMLKTSLAHITGQDSDVFGEFAPLPDLTLDKSVSEIYILARNNSFTVKAMENEVREMEAEVRMKELEMYPDFTITAGYEPRFSEMDDVWTVGVAFNLPLYYKTKQKPAADSARAKKYKADTLLADMRHELRSMVTEFVASAEAAERIMELYRGGVIGKSRLLRDSSLAGYRQGMMPASEVIAAVNTSIEYEMKYLEQNSLRQKKLSALNTLTGGTLYGTQIPE